MQRNVTDVIMSFKKQNKRDILNTILEEPNSQTQSMIIHNGGLQGKKMSRIELGDKGQIETSFLKSIASNENLVHHIGANAVHRKEEGFNSSMFVENQMKLGDGSHEQANNYRSMADPIKVDNNEFIKLMMEDTIRSGDTERVVNELLNNNFGDHLMQLHHSRQASMQNTQQLSNIEIDMAENQLPLPEDLSDSIEINTDFLTSI